MADLIDRIELLDAMPKNDELLSLDVRRIILAQQSVEDAMQKPLTLEESKSQRAVWIEDDGCEYETDLFPAIYDGKGFPNHSVFSEHGDESVWYDNGEYGVSWRCWLRKPTDAEREDVPWECAV